MGGTASTLFRFRPTIFRGCYAAVIVCFAPVSLPAQQQTPPNSQLISPKIDARINALLQQMTLEEKIGQLVQYGGEPTIPAPATGKKGEKGAADVNPGAQHPDAMALAEKGLLGTVLNTWGERAGALQHAAVEKGRLHIPLLFGADVIHGYRTIFPIPLAMASSFDPDLIAQTAHTAALEATSAGVKWVYSPMVDIARDARWGRVAEGAGEDPYLGSAIARAYVRGFQNNDLSAPENVAACVKHYAAYGAAEGGRDYNTTDMSDVTLRQVYLQPYKAAVEAGAATVMTSFNSLNGVPATGNRYLLTKILRQEWHFNGFVVSDYNAIGELIQHGIALDGAAAVQKAINAGVEVDLMAHLYDKELPALVHSGRVSQATLDEAVRRVLRVKLALGIFEHPYARPGGEVTAAVADHRPLARRAAEESIILLKNDPASDGLPVLPLRKDRKKIALIGPLADAASEMPGTWAMGARDQDIVTVRAALEEQCKLAGCSLDYQKGTDIEGNSEAGFGPAIEAARTCGCGPPCAGRIARHERRSLLAHSSSCPATSRSCSKPSRLSANPPLWSSSLAARSYSPGPQSTYLPSWRVGSSEMKQGPRSPGCFSAKRTQTAECRSASTRSRTGTPILRATPHRSSGRRP